MPEKQRFLTIGEAAQFLNVSEVSLRRWTNSGKLRCFRVGGRSERRFLIDDLLAFMSSTTGEPELQSAEVPALAEPHERHISLFFRNQDEQWQLIRPYLLEYLSAGAPALYLQHSTSSQQLMEKLHAEGLQTMDEDDDLLTAMARELVTRQGVGMRAAEIWKGLTKVRESAAGAVIEESPASQPIEVPKESEEPKTWIPSKGAAVQLSLF